jgi:hypothetical protein
VVVNIRRSGFSKLLKMEVHQFKGYMRISKHFNHGTLAWKKLILAAILHFQRLLDNNIVVRGIM